MIVRSCFRTLRCQWVLYVYVYICTGNTRTVYMQLHLSISMSAIVDQKVFLRWYGTPFDSNMDKRTLSKCFHRFKILQYFTKKWILKIGQVKIIKVPAEFELMTSIFVVIILTHCATLSCIHLQIYNWFYCIFRQEVRHNMVVSHTTLIIFF